ncbi:Dihydroxy-acid dehydratase [uncultured Clostridium sp.]|uniref:Dihydroxy-acid dehydratase n=1 Tax=Muricoprocola aceti TaxID=2981772 RepID=A0ABT2SNC6_9FIRM|nr:dihydroxy-acid dehydratase [Muricoprocola aceti]MCU6726019.1 dihydroxy-acid dehydratase [Muricoprocola aceti]SCH74590.1 Dihydroxy-acid dehydratase [uncultured Clostridium sp.]
MNYRSQDILRGAGFANVRALYKADGFTDDELKRPIIAIANSYNSICPGHIVFRQMADRIKEGIQAAGGMPIEFGTIGACDGIAMGHNGMRYILPAREMIANDVEAMVQAHRLDGIVLLGSCDKIIPGMLIGAMRVNLPTILVNGGPALPGHMGQGNPYGGEYIDHSFIQQSEGALRSGDITQEEFDWIENNAVPTVGSCAMLGTANTMGCLAEAMGIMLPGVSSIPAVYSKRMAAAYDTGKAIVELVMKNIRVRDIMTKEALKNAIRINSAIGGSTNAVLHILAIAREGKIDLDIREFGEVSKEVAHLVAMIPAGQYTLLDFYEAGGVPALMQGIADNLALDVLTCTGETLETNLKRAKNLRPEVIRAGKDPVHTRSGIGILYGNIAPEGSVTKPSAIPDDALYFCGKAKVYEGEEEALKSIRSGDVSEGQVVVIRNEGPKGGPGMPEMYKAMKLLVGMGLGSKVCLITDGRFSGSNNGCFVGHICPEAANDGPIAYLKDGDEIIVDVKNGTIDAPFVDFDARRKEPYTYRRKVEGYLYQYAKNVKSASLGAAIPSCEGE